MRTGTKILAAVGTLLALVVLAVVVAFATLDVDALIVPVRDRVKAATGRDLAVRGGASIAWSLQPRVVLKDVTLANAPWGTAKDMVTARQLELEFALLPLLSRRFELIELKVVDPVIALETGAQGQRNWQLPPAPAGQGAAAGAAAGGGTPFALTLGNVAIANGTLTYRDIATGAVTPVAIDRLSVRARDAGSPIAAEFRGKVGDVPVALEGSLGSLETLLQRRAPYPVDVHGEVAGQKSALATKVRAEASRYVLDDLKLTVGANAVTGSFAVETGGARPKLAFDLAGPAIALNALPLPVAAPATAAPAAPAAPKAGRAFLFSETPVDFAPLRSVDAQGSLKLGQVTLPDGRRFDDLRAKVALDGGRLAVTDFAVALFGGTLTGSAVVDATRPEHPALTVELAGKGLALADLLAATGQRRDVRGGKTDVDASLALRGASPHAWAGSATGTLRIVVGQATLANTKLDLDVAIDRIAQAVNPFRTRDPATELTCAVVRLPLANGVARVDRSIAMETQKLGVSASGMLDFRNETLDFSFQPKLREGITLDIPNFAELVRVSGPFAAPQISIDAAGSAKAIASIGAAVGTGGLSLVGQSLLSWAGGKGPGPCQIALSGAAATTSAASAPADKAAAGVEDVGRAIGKLFSK